jgi:hypothetical protein
VPLRTDVPARVPGPGDRAGASEDAADGASAGSPADDGADDPVARPGGFRSASEGALRRFRSRPLQVKLAWLGAAAIPLLVVISLLASGLADLRNRPASRSAGNPAAAGAPATRVPDLRSQLPRRLAFVAGPEPIGSAPGGLRIVEGIVGTTGMLAPEGGRGATSFAWSPDGQQLATIDGHGRVRMVPGSSSYAGPVGSLVYSHAGTLVAVCSAGPRPELSIRTARPALPLVRDVGPGCDPHWSTGDVFLAFRAPPARPGGHERRGIVTSGDSQILPVPGAGPMAWAPPQFGGPNVLTTFTPDCTALQTVDPFTQATRVLVDLRDLSPVSGVRGCHITMLAWAPSGRWVAMAVAAEGPAPARVLVIDPRTRIILPLPIAALALQPDSLAWSPDGDTLLISGMDGHKGPFTLASDPSGERLARHLQATDASWSPDGRWIVAHAAAGWFAYLASDTDRYIGLKLPATARNAAWCCPPPEVVRPSSAQSPGGRALVP